MILGRTRKMPRGRSRSRPRLAAHGGVHSFRVHSRIAKAVGEDKRYKLNAVRALPSREKGKVVLQASNGQQAVCVLVPGRLSSPRLVPPRCCRAVRGARKR